jgi:hypothetical protein
MTVKFKKIPFFGEGVYAGNPTVTRERRLNVYYQVRKDKDRTSIAVLPTPGLLLAMTITAAVKQGARGLLANQSQLFTVVGSQFLSLGGPTVAGGAASQIAMGTLNTISGPVAMGANPTQIGIVDGVNGYYFTPSTGAFAQITSAGFPNGAKTLTMCNGFGICESPGTNQFFVSNFNDLSTWSALSFAEASQYPDILVGLDQLGGLLLPFSSTHLEFWQNSGLTTEPFTYIQNTATEYGLAAPFSRVHVADSIAFLAQSLEGGIQFARIKGYGVEVISTPDIDKIIQAAGFVVSDCEALAYQTQEAKFAQFTFPTMNRSFLWNAANGMWSETQTGVTSAYAARHLGRWSAVYKGQILISDYQTSNLYTPTVGQYTDNGNTIVREVITRCALNDQNYFRAGQIYFDFETGVGASSPSSQGFNPMVMMQLSRDSRDFGPEQWIKLGKQGQSRTRVTRRRCGRARFMHVRMRMTDPAKFVISGGAAIISSPSGRAAVAGGRS